MENYVKDKVIVVTGAGSGLGKKISQMAADLGAKVVAADIHKDNVKSVAEAIKDKGQTAEYVETDVAERAEMNDLAAFAIKTFKRIDVLVNNAGIRPLSHFFNHEEAADAWDLCIDINLKGVVNGISAVYDQMAQQEQGHIVNISSIYGNHGIAGSGVYSATKAAVNVLSDALRVETQGKIKVTTVKPTNIPNKGLGNAAVNNKGILGIAGHKAESYEENMEKFVNEEVPAKEKDPESIKYWTTQHDELARNIIYAINQPLGVNISDVTVRASGEQYVF